MAYNAEAIANEVLRIARGVSVPIQPMKLQKLVYYCHGWNLALSDSPLITEDVKAWKYGPVIPSLYHEFKEFGNSPIDRDGCELRVTGDGDWSFESYSPDISSQSNGNDEDEYAHALIEKIWQLYGKYSAIQLSRMTHTAGTPWHQVANRYNFSPPPGINIPNEIIEKYFKEKLSQPLEARGLA